jgi:hypothetical protein
LAFSKLAVRAARPPHAPREVRRLRCALRAKNVVTQL